MARVLDSEAYHERVRALLTGGKTFAVCRRQAAAELAGETAAVLLDSPNNNLGVEYCRALHALNGTMRPLTIPRTGAEHDGIPQAGIASASYIRSLLREGKTGEAAAFLPVSSAEILRREMAAGRGPADERYCERAVLARLRTMEEADFRPYDGGGEGLSHRIFRAVQESCSVAEILDRAKTKRYTYARLRRLLLSAWLEMPAPALQDRPPCLRVLAANETGRGLLRRMRRNGVPVLTKPADADRISPEAGALLRAEARRTDLYVLAYPQISHSPCGEEWRQGPILL